MSTVAATSTLDPAFERCIRENAPKVEQAISDLSAATTFLVESVCAVERSTAQRQQQEQQFAAMRSQMQRQCDARRASGQTPPKATDEDGSFDACQAADAYDNMSAAVIVNGTYTPPAALALAAHVLVDLRLSHTTH
ncbi:MAG: hypothetical protein ABUL55_03060 [Pseudomonadota bacterium]